MYKTTTDFQSLFDKIMPRFLQGYISHPYKTRQASGGILELPATAPTPSTSSVSSMDDFSTVSAEDQHEGRGRGVRGCVRRKRRRGSGSGRGRRRASNNDSASSESDGGDDDGNEEDDGQNSPRSVSVSSSYINHYNHYHHLESVPVTRRQTRSMGKDSSLPSPDDVLANNERFPMTLRARSQRRRKRFYDSEEEEGEEDEEESVDGGASEEESVVRSRTRKGRPCLKQEVSERSTRNLRKRPKRTKYFDDDDYRIS